MAWTCTAASEDELTATAKEIFSKLKLQWMPKERNGGGYSIYWRLGHSFDTIIDYFAFVDSAEAAGFQPIALEARERSLGNACWYDDFGWWGIAALKASQHPELFNDPAPFVAIYEGCWSAMHDNAPNVWENNKDNPSFAPLQPRFEGGVWNCDWSRPDGCGGHNRPPTVPSQCTDKAQGSNLTGIQNTVTNGLYLVLASRLYEATGNAIYQQAADREYGFLGQWLDLPDNEISLLRRLSLSAPGEENDVLVRERAATYASGDTVCGFEPELSWSGDQGIIVGGMIDRMLVDPNEKKPGSPAFARASGILEGVAYIANEQTGGVLQPWTSGNGGDPEDYATGVGVFMRYLLYADQRLADMRTVTRSPSYRKLLDANVKDVLTNPPIDDLVALTNGLAILVAAIVMSRN